MAVTDLEDVAEAADKLLELDEIVHIKKLCRLSLANSAVCNAIVRLPCGPSMWTSSACYIIYKCIWAWSLAQYPK